MTTAVFLGVEATKEASTLDNVRFMSTTVRRRTLPSEDKDATEPEDALRDMTMDAVGMQTEVDDPSGEMGTDEVAGVLIDSKDGIVGREAMDRADREEERSEDVLRCSCSWSCWTVFNAAASASLASFSPD